MTRGQIAIITDSEIITSIEFNGDMYMPDGKWAGYGQEVIDLLKGVNDKERHEEIVKEFNETHHKYSDCRTYRESLDYLDMSSKDYFNKWFSDYVYIKNISKKDAVFTDYNGKSVILPVGKIGVFNFGELELIA